MVLQGDTAVLSLQEFTSWCQLLWTNGWLLEFCSTFHIEW